MVMWMQALLMTAKVLCGRSRKTGLAAWRQRPVRISTALSTQGLHLHLLVSWSREASPSIRGRGNGLTDQPATQNRITCEDFLMDNISRVRLTDGLECAH